MVNGLKPYPFLAKFVSLLLIYLFFNCSYLGAQSNLPPVYELKADTFLYETLSNNNWQAFEDSTGKLTIDQVIQPSVSSGFHQIPVNERVDYKFHYYWLRYRLKNIMSKEARICLTNSTNADQSDFYLQDSLNMLTHYVTGILYPAKRRNGLKNIDNIPIIIPPGQEILIYNRIKNFYFINKPKSLFITIGSTDKVIQESYIGSEPSFSFRDFTAVFDGILLFGCLFSLFFYAIVKNKVYLYYALFLFYFSFNREFLADFFLPNYPFVSFLADTLVHASGILLFVQFSKYFLKTYEFFPIWDRALKAIAILHPVGILASFFIEPFLIGSWSGSLNWISNLFFVIGLFMILITYLKFIGDRNNLIEVLQVSAMPGLIFWAFGFTLTFLFDFLKEKYDYTTPVFINWLNSWFDVFNILTVVWLALSFSWVLLLQFVQLRKDNERQAIEKERLAKEKEIERNQLIEVQKLELEKTVEARTSELKQSIQALQSTQKQLIQSEKMASLGELTAGIAHEIQNPLNFVNNFSDVNREMIAEMKQEMAIGNISEAKTIADNIEQNEEKINHHGKRADAIVKSMLQHSRGGSGIKELTDINALTQEYLRLAYQGYRTKDKLFNVTLNTSLDNNAGKLNIIPQDIGKVLLNIYNNAFYAVAEKSKQMPVGYEPTVSISTHKLADSMEIRVTDNGNGIPQKLIDKVFQPFFTTKPTGQGTGLGLSLSYDIIKAHGGEIRVETKEGEGTMFAINLLSA